MTIAFLSEVLTPAERKVVGCNHPADTKWPVTSEHNALEALKYLQTIALSLHTYDEERVMTKLRGALFALYPQLKKHDREYDGR